jgi:hypothetical protein
MTFKDVTLAVETLLLADSAVSAKVGTRIYRAELPPNPQFPLIKVLRIDKVPEPKTSSSKYAVARIQCSTAAETDTAAEEISDLIGDALGDVQDQLVSGVLIVEIEDQIAVPDNSDGKELKKFWDNHDFKITYLR